MKGFPTTSPDYILSNDARDELHGQQLPGRLLSLRKFLSAPRGDVAGDFVGLPKSQLFIALCPEDREHGARALVGAEVAVEVVASRAA